MSNVTMSREDFKRFTLNTIDHMDDSQYDRFSEILLSCCGVIDENGCLSKDYADSPYWEGGDDGTPLRISKKAEDTVRLAGIAEGMARYVREQGGGASRRERRKKRRQ